MPVSRIGVCVSFSMLILTSSQQKRYSVNGQGDTSLSKLDTQSRNSSKYGNTFKGKPRSKSGTLGKQKQYNH